MTTNKRTIWKHIRVVIAGFVLAVAAGLLGLGAIAILVVVPGVAITFGVAGVVTWAAWELCT